MTVRNKNVNFPINFRLQWINIFTAV